MLIWKRSFLEFFGNKINVSTSYLHIQHICMSCILIYLYICNWMPLYLIKSPFSIELYANLLNCDSFIVQYLLLKFFKISSLKFLLNFLTSGYLDIQIFRSHFINSIYQRNIEITRKSNIRPIFNANVSGSRDANCVF